MRDLTVTVIQSDLVWEDISKNLSAFSDKISSIGQDTDLIILPEMFNTGFTMDAHSNAEEMEGPTMNWMAQKADNTNAAVAGSLIIREGSQYFNRLIWMFPGGMYQVYDKRHLFSMAGENQHFTSGEERLRIKHNGWRICPMICYDLRFPVWSRNNSSYDLLIYVANWPDRRSYDWLTLLKARAIENQSYVIGVNRVGIDGNGHNYNGDSCIIDPGWRKTLWHAEKNEVIYTTKLSAEHLLKVRKSLPFLTDKDDYVIL